MSGYSDFDQIIASLGHRNWIAVVDSAFPDMTAHGVVTLTNFSLETVISALRGAKHLRFEAFIDEELDYLREEEAPGVGAFRARLVDVLEGGVPTKLPHEELIAMLEAAAQSFRVIIAKTDLLIPYTSLFLRLECGYWDASSEVQLRARMNLTKQELIA